jgi:hypothetical protein
MTPLYHSEDEIKLIIGGLKISNHSRFGNKNTSSKRISIGVPLLKNNYLIKTEKMQNATLTKRINSSTTDSYPTNPTSTTSRSNNNSRNKKRNQKKGKREQAKTELVITGMSGGSNDKREIAILRTQYKSLQSQMYAIQKNAIKGMANYSPAMKAVIKMILDPERANTVRIPLTTSQATSTLKIIENLSISINPTINSGAFSASFSPVLGSNKSVGSRWCSMAVPANIVDGTDWSDQQFWYNTNAGTDLITHSASRLYTNPELSYGEMLIIPNVVHSPWGAGPNSTLSPGFTSGTHPVIISNPTTNTARVKIPEGLWRIELFAGYPALSATPTVFTPTLQTQLSSSPNVTFQLDLNYELVTGAANVQFLAYMNINIIGGEFAVIDFVDNSAQNATSGEITMMPIFSYNILPNLPVPSANPMHASQNTGEMDSIISTAMSVLVTCVAPLEFTGGRCGIAMVTDDDATKNYFNTANDSTKQLQFLGNLSNLDGAYEGALINGAYAFILPFDVRQFEFVLPDDQADPDRGPKYNYIIFDAKFTPTAPANQLYEVFRARINTCFEFTTMNPCIEKMICLGSSAELEAAYLFLGQMSTCMANGTHLDFIKSVLSRLYATGKKVYGFYQDNSDVINAGVKLASSLVI